MANPFDDLIQQPARAANPFDDIVPSSSVGTFARTAIDEATRVLPLRLFYELYQARTALTDLRAGRPERAQQYLNRIEQREQRSREHPIASGLGQVVGMTPAFLTSGVATKALQKLPQVYRYAATPAGRTVLRTALLGLQGTGAELIQGRPQNMLGTGLAVGAIGPAQAIPNLPLPGRLRALGFVPRALATAASAGGASAALAPPGERVRAGAFGAGIGAVAGGLPAYDPLRRTRFDTPSVIAARARNAGVSLEPQPPLSPERMALRRVIADEVYGTGAPQKQKQAYIVIGPSASGKSTQVAEPLARKTGSLVIDSDQIKAELAKRLGVPLERAGILQRESSDIAENALLGRAIAGGDNFVLPLIGKATQKIQQYRDNLVARGYQVHLVLVELPIGKAAGRAVARYTQRLKTTPEQARFVDPEYVLSIGQKPQATYKALKGGFTSYAKFSTDVATGSVPRLVEVSPGSPVAGLSIYGGEVGRANLAKVIVSETIGQGGITIDVNGNMPTGDVYVVSPYKARELVVDKSRFDESVAARYLKQHEQNLQQPGHSVGGWYNRADGNIYLDNVTVHASQVEANQVGLASKQQSIHKWLNHEDIPVHAGPAEGTGRIPGILRPHEADVGGVGLGGQGQGGGGGPGGGSVPTAPGPEGPVSPRLIVRSTEEIASAAQRLIQRDPADPIATEQAPRLFQRIAAALRQGRISADDIPALRDAGLTTEEAAGLFEEAASFSGQTLNRLSQVWRQIEQLAPDLAKTLDQAPSPPLTAWQRLQNLPRQTVNLWRASLVSQLATAVRNFAVFHQRLAFKVIEDGVNGAFESVTGRKPTAQAFGPMLEDVLAYGRAFQRGNRARVLQLISQGDPLLKEKLMYTPVSDATITGRYAKLIGTFNNTQEYFSRTVVADAVMAGELRRGGFRGQAPSVPVLKKAVDRALDLTFAKYPSSKTGQAFLKAWNNPILNVLTYPFPRYLTNAVRAIWEHSPAGAMRLLHPRYQAILRSGDPRAAIEIATRAGLGSTMFATASWIRNSKFAGEKWYEIRVGDKTVDARPYGPLLPVYLFLAQAFKDSSQFQLRDWVEGTLGINRMAGTTLFLTSVLAGENPQTLKRKLAEFAGTFAGGFTVPLRTFQDFVAQFSKEEATIRETREAPLTGPTRTNIPFVSRGLPEKRVVTRGGPIHREQPGLRQLTGLTVKTKTPLERELDRLGLAPFQLEPRLGEQSIERSIITRMGPIAERQIGAIVRSARYRQLDDEQRTELLRRAFSELRRGAKAHLIETEPGVVAKPFQRQFQQGTPQQRRQLQESLKRKGLFRGRVPQALLR